jgi:hypothetical protein
MSIKTRPLLKRKYNFFQKGDRAPLGKEKGQKRLIDVLNGVVKS